MSEYLKSLFSPRNSNVTKSDSSGPPFTPQPYVPETDTHKEKTEQNSQKFQNPQSQTSHKPKNPQKLKVPQKSQLPKSNSEGTIPFIGPVNPLKRTSIAHLLLENLPQIPDSQEIQSKISEIRPPQDLREDLRALDVENLPPDVILEETKNFLSELNDELADHLGIYELTIKDLLRNYMTYSRKTQILEAYKSLEQENKHLQQQIEIAKEVKKNLQNDNEQLSAILKSGFPNASAQTEMYANLTELYSKLGHLKEKEAANRCLEMQAKSYLVSISQQREENKRLNTTKSSLESQNAGLRQDIHSKKLNFEKEQSQRPDLSSQSRLLSEIQKLESEIEKNTQKLIRQDFSKLDETKKLRDEIFVLGKEGRIEIPQAKSDFKNVIAEEAERFKNLLNPKRGIKTEDNHAFFQVDESQGFVNQKRTISDLESETLVTKIESVHTMRKNWNVTTNESEDKQNKKRKIQ